MKKSMIEFEFATCLQENNIRLVCFDFDDTITKNHLQEISQTFIRLVHCLHQMNFYIAVTTFNETFNIEGLFESSQIFKNLKPFPIIIPIFSRATNIDFEYGKLWHIIQAMKFFNLPPNAFHQVLLIDDLRNNIKRARDFNIVALEVQRRQGLQEEDLFRFLANVQFYFHPQGRKFIPSLNRFSTWTFAYKYMCHLVTKPSEILYDSQVINVILQKDDYGNPYLIGIKCNQSEMQCQPMFLVVEPKLEIFLKDLIQLYPMHKIL